MESKSKYEVDFSLLYGKLFQKILWQHFFPSGIYSRNPKEGLRRVIISRRHLDAVFWRLMCPLRGNAKRERARSRPSFGFWRPLYNPLKIGEDIQ